MHHVSEAGPLRAADDDALLVDGDNGVIAVFDGSGAEGGRAARLARDTVARVITERAWVLRSLRPGDGRAVPDDAAMLLRDAFEQANTALFTEGRRLGVPLISTCTTVCDLGDRLVVAHVGDSRAYLVGGGGVTRLTEDQLVAAGGVPGTRATDGDTRPDAPRELGGALGAGDAVLPDVRWTMFEPDELVVLCTDGLSDHLLRDDEIEDTARRFPGFAVADVLLDLALTRGSGDNITVGIIDRASPEDDAHAASWDEQRASLVLLRDTPPLAGLSMLELDELRSAAEVVGYDRGAPIRFDDPRAFGVVLSGTVLLHATRQADVAGRLEAGGVLGEAAVPAGAAWPYRAVAEDDAEMLVVPGWAVDRLLERRPRAAAVLLWELLAAAGARAALPNP